MMVAPSRYPVVGSIRIFLTFFIGDSFVTWVGYLFEFSLGILGELIIGT